MVIGAFPIAKLGILAVKQISKPISALTKRAAQQNSFIKSYIVTPPAQLYNQIEVRSKLWLLNLGQPKRIPPLSQDMAIRMGSDILSELLIFIIGVSLILGEFSRQSRNDTRKHEKHKADRLLLEQRITDLCKRIEHQAKEVKDLKAQFIESHESTEQECY
ncbi:putative OPA3-like protein CG13603 [Drosophila willistoni]|uniref:putative OPA3-like protein CG13603 n=1 Tax=Drosophila willistoni TaxID=7260 RepID=UPI000C26C280|nr:putative OPA3-like protein CG13603 [Drosophila willistoni]